MHLIFAMSRTQQKTNNPAARSVEICMTREKTAPGSGQSAKGMGPVGNMGKS
jgi:hypothetical protein